MINQRFNISLFFVVLLFCSGNSPAALNKATEALQAKDFDVAIQYLDEASQEERDSSRWQLLRAIAEAGNGDLEVAEKRYLGLIERTPQLAEAYNNLAAIYARQGRFAEAIMLLKKAMEANESHAIVSANLRSIYYEMSRTAYARALQVEKREDGTALGPILQIAIPNRSRQTAADITLKEASAGQVTVAEAVLVNGPASVPMMEALQEIGSNQQLFAQALKRLKQRVQTYPADYEASLLIALLRFESGDLEGALGGMRELLKREPKFHLAHLVEGDMLLAQSRAISDITTVPAVNKDGDGNMDVSRLREEAEARLQAYLDPPPQGRLPRVLLWLDEQIETTLVVDKAGHRLYLYRRGDDGEPQLSHDYYVTTGKLEGNKRIRGDLRTPEGVYFITSYIPDRKLPDLYGIGAYPMNYPNEWDSHLGKTGSGIWLHGTPSALYSRPPLDSRGCVVLPNLDLKDVEQYLHLGVTPIIVAERVEWLEREKWFDLRNEVAQALEQWRSDWAGGDVESYLGHYAKDFWSGSKKLSAWKAYKRRVAAGKSWQKVDISKLSLFAYPQTASQKREMVVARFHQRYDSNNFSNEMDKILYLVKEEGRWRVLYEGKR